MPSTQFKDLKCDPWSVPPDRTVRDCTAYGILDAVTAPGPASVQEVRAAVVRAGGSLDMINQAAKALRNMGYPIVAVNRRHLTQWTYGWDASEMERWRLKTAKRAYSAAVSSYRSLLGACRDFPNDSVFERSRINQQVVAVSLGVEIGLTLQQIDTDLQILTGPGQNTGGTALSQP